MGAMKVFAPDYYTDFQCTAGACRHTCCAGWEIDVDLETLKRYQAMDDPLGIRLRRHIALEPEPHFMLSAQDRCPFLTEQNLCEIILQAGKESLCQICADHPRFRNYWSDRIEMGLGMACEAAAGLILSSPHPLRLVCVSEEADEQPVLPSEEESALLNYRNRLLASVAETGPAARLREYLIYRHLADALYDGRIAERSRLVDRAFESITAGWDGQSISALAEKARAFSDEVEYDDEKLELLLTEA